MNEYVDELRSVVDRLRCEATAADSAASDVRTAIGDGLYFEGRAAGLCEAANALDAVLSSLVPTLTVVPGYVTPSGAPMSLLAQDDVMSRFRVLSTRERPVNGS